MRPRGRTDAPRVDLGAAGGRDSQASCAKIARRCGARFPAQSGQQVVNTSRGSFDDARTVWSSALTTLVPVTLYVNLPDRVSRTIASPGLSWPNGIQKVLCAATPTRPGWPGRAVVG